MYLSQPILAFAAILLASFTTTPVTNKVDYTEFKKNVAYDKSRLINRPTKEISNYLFKLINDDIYDYWTGTPWEFHGATQQPKTGSIACGYFVTTTLTDLGFKIDRVALAEGRSGDMIKKICVHIRAFNSLDKLNSYLAKQPINSVFIIGLDFHTGYIIKTAEECYFMNSSFHKKQVVKEKLALSTDLRNNKFFMIGSLTANASLLRKWVTDKVVI